MCNSHFFIFLPCKHDANGTRAGIAADGGADVCLVAFLEAAVFLQPRLHCVHAAGLRLAGGDEHKAVLDVVAFHQTVGDVLAHADGQAAAVFLTTFSSPSITSSAGLMPSRFAPKASTPEQRPLLAIKSSRSSTKLSSTRLARLCSRIVMLRGAGHLQPTWPLSAPDSPARYRYSGCPPHRHSRIRLPPASHSGSRTKACC